MSNRTPILCVLIALAVAGSALWYVKETQETVTGALSQRIIETRATLVTLATQTDRNQADDVVNDVIVDCGSRQEFESLLSRLATLERDELLRTKELFDLCGDFFAVSKAFMVSRFERERDVFNDYIELYQELSGGDRYTELQNTWNRIFFLEEQKSDLLTEQVDIQRAIIDLLLEGESTTSDKITDHLTRAQEVAQLLLEADQEVDALRAAELDSWTERESS